MGPLPLVADFRLSLAYLSRTCPIAPLAKGWLYPIK